MDLPPPELRGVEAARATPADVLAAYRLFLGRDPEGEAAIAPWLARAPRDLAATLARSGEFRAVLERLATDRLPPHAALAPEAVAEAARWGAALGLLPEPPEPGAAGLLRGLLGAEPVQPALAALPERLRARLAALRRDPRRGLLHRLGLPATAEDAHRLGLLLHGAPPAEAPRAEGSLLRLLRAALGAPRFRDQVLTPLREGRPPPFLALPPGEAAACAGWLAARLGLAVPDGAAPGAPLAAFLGLPAIRDLLARLWPAEQEGAVAALPALASGEIRLGGLRATDADVGLAYLALLGRMPESAATRRAQEGTPLRSLLAGLATSAEFRAQVLARLAEGDRPPQAALPAAQRRAVAGWLAGRLGLPVAGGEAAPPAAALLRRLLSLPGLAAEAAGLHGVLWHDAMAALDAWHEAETRGATGGIDYVTGELIVGWALDRGRPGEALEVEILCNGLPVGAGRADRPRPQAAEEGTGECGFRIPWQGRARMEAEAEAEAFRFEIRDRATGRPLGAPFRLDSVFVRPRTTLQLVAAEMAEMRRHLRRLEALLPQLESFAAFPPEGYAAFRRQHRVAPPPAPPPGLGPALRVVVEAEGVSARGLRRTLDSLSRQSWPRWTAACLVRGAERRALVEAAAARDPRFLCIPLDAAEAMGAAERRAAAEGAEPLVLLLPPGALLEEAALAWFAHAALACPAARGFFCDEDAVAEAFRDQDRHEAPVFRTALDEWELPRRNPCGELLCARREALAAALDAVDPAAPRAARRWLAWAALARQGPVAHLPRLLLSVQRETVEEEAPPPSPPAAALRPLLRRPWLLDAAEDGSALAEARISVIVPTRNGAALLREALASLLGKAAAPQAIEPLVVDNGSDAPETLAFLETLRGREGHAVLRLDEPFNWSRLNNLAARQARGELLLFLNDDTRMLTAGWDRRLRRLLAEPDVGAVGARLVYEDFTLQHAGVVFGTEGLAAHEGVGAPMEAEGPGGRWQRLRRVGAVTGAFLACRREVFERLGPFDEQALGVTFNDVDFCLRLRAAGLAVLYAPEIALVHCESKSRGLDDLDPAKQERAAFERRMLAERWGGAVLLDPGFNPHWSRWTRPFVAIREPSAAEIAAHLAASASPDPWNPLPRMGEG
ncbi:glycosyltransferase family 2 protein [Crenalkalicoccus roseus]|uniref:glycosyltransferase family 2 protein n=1 Tax=Crenalkalicoccus roseus TaxID=1485588 RepID=UPI00108133BD|nr:glycosyltransferase family 2 protein [Crenalkalicoccus roseus]